MILLADGWLRLRVETPLRKEIRARPVDFRASVTGKASILGVMLTARGWLDLTVRGDAFEVSHPFVLARLLFAQDYCFRADDTTVEVIPGLLHDWIEVWGQQAGPTARIRIGRRNVNRAVWEALVRAGAHPIGSPPL